MCGRLKKIVLVLFAATLFISLNVFATSENIELNLESWGEDVATGFDGGEGSMQNPYQISTPQQLAYMATVVNSDDVSVRERFITAHYILTDNIDISGKNWVPIGLNSYNREFRGHLDGNDKTITGLTIGDIPDNNSVGLFSYIGGNSVIKNLNISDVMIDTSSTLAGSVAGKADSATTLYNVDVLSGSINIKNNGLSHASGLGGLIGEGNTTVYYSSNAASLSQNIYAGSTGYVIIGGIIGEYGTAVGCVNTGSITFNSVSDNTSGKAYIGGIIGSEGKVYNSINRGDIVVDESAATRTIALRVGGITTYGPVVNSINEGDITYTDLSTSSSRHSSVIAGISASTTYDDSVHNCVNTGVYTPTKATEVVYDTISKSLTYNSYWSSSLSHGNSSSGLQTLYYSGTFLPDGTLSTASNSVGDIPYSDILTALNSWADEGVEKHLYMPVQWNYSGGDFSFTAAGDVTVNVVKDNGTAVSDAVIELRTADGALLYTHNGASASYQALEKGRYIVEVNAPGMLDQYYLWENIDGSGLEIKLIELITPEVVDGEIIIDSIGNLAYISQQVYDMKDDYEGDTLVLNKDIDLTGYNWTPIGYIDHIYLSSSDTSIPFMGTFDGNGNSISGLSINAADGSAGLFGHVRSATIKSLTMYDVKITGFARDAGALVGTSWSRENYTSQISTSISDVNVRNVSITTGIPSSNSIKPAVGGLVGSFAGGSITDCEVLATSSIKNHSEYYAGGVVGAVPYSHSYAPNMNGSFSMSDINNFSSVYCEGTAGGIVGHTAPYSSSTSSISFVRNYGVITAGANGGGIVGAAEEGTVKISNSDNFGTLYAASREGRYAVDMGGIIGEVLNYSIIDRCVSAADIVMHNRGALVGGIVGNGDKLGAVINCTSYAAITGSTNDANDVWVGGIVGSADLDDFDAVIANNHNAGYINVNEGFEGRDAEAGGIVGRATPTVTSKSLIIHNNYNKATVTLPDRKGASIIDVVGGDTDVSYNYSLALIGQPIIGSTVVGDISPSANSNATFESNLGTLTAVTGEIPKFNIYSQSPAVSYLGEPIALTLVDALNGFIGDETLNSTQGLIGWIKIIGLNEGYPIIKLLPDYDVNNDGRVNIADLRIIIDPSNYNKPTSAAANAAADVNKDGVINFMDIAATRNSSVFTE